MVYLSRCLQSSVKKTVIELPATIDAWSDHYTCLEGGKTWWPQKELPSAALDKEYVPFVTSLRSDLHHISTR